MKDSKDNLIAKYLAGDSDADEVQELNRALADDPQAADALMFAAYVDVHLRETLSGSALGAAIAEDVRPASSCAARLSPRRWLAAAMLLAAVAGWVVAAYVAGELGKARTNVNTLVGRVAELERAFVRRPAAVAKSNVPEIRSMRGLLMALPQNGDTESQTLLIGTAAPLNRSLWTCPWGAAEFRYESGVSISVERNTTVKFNETDDLRRLTLEHGIVHVTNMSESDDRPTEIKCPLATVRLIQGQVAIQVDKRRTAVEAAINQVEVLAEEEGVVRTFTVRRGHYLIIAPGEKPKVVQGMLQLELEPPSA